MTLAFNVVDNFEGSTDGIRVGFKDGDLEGDLEGLLLGERDGRIDGFIKGNFEGTTVGNLDGGFDELGLVGNAFLFESRACVWTSIFGDDVAKECVGKMQSGGSNGRQMLFPSQFPEQHGRASQDLKLRAQKWLSSKSSRGRQRDVYELLLKNSVQRFPIGQSSSEAQYIPFSQM
eukprot:CAMPEP_0170118042 /NCGR_PEP_ID=MMETSP0020_2-20130122/13434_1 /TAXON_ID=98059 /ORGANISM="Dinobryon sp., Strain UTEXLB2267" /LENGTH=174 /DNA_ID=CAMNT_0010346885 /DNA_START=939 /DNA_END=1460 /DNA_ORIENTATION=+